MSNSECVPAAADEATVRGWIAEAIAEVCPDGPDKKLMGKVMGALMKKHRRQGGEQVGGRDAHAMIGAPKAGREIESECAQERRTVHAIHAVHDPRHLISDCVVWPSWRRLRLRLSPWPRHARHGCSLYAFCCVFTALRVRSRVRGPPRAGCGSRSGLII
jgi:hypothetical protein